MVSWLVNRRRWDGVRVKREWKERDGSYEEQMEKREDERLTMVTFRNSISDLVSRAMCLGGRGVLLSLGLLVNWRGVPPLSAGLLICERVAVLS